MATVARVLGTMCILLAIAVLSLGVWRYLDLRDATISYRGDETRFFEGVAAFYLIGSFTTALTLATVGVTAVLAGNAVDRLARDRYLPRYQNAPAAPTVTPQWQPVPGPPWQPPAATTRPRTGPMWGPPRDAEPPPGPNAPPERRSPPDDPG